MKIYECVFTLRGKEYIPLRAIPRATGGFFQPRQILAKLGDPDPGITPYLQFSDGSGLVPGHQLRTLLGVAQPELPAGMAIELEKLRQWCGMEGLYSGDRSSIEIYGQSTAFSLPTYELLLSEADYKYIMAGVPAINRKKSGPVSLAQTYEQPMQEVMQACNKHGIALDLQSLPQPREFWRKLLEDLGGRTVAPTTFHDYFKNKELKWKWKKGRQQGLLRRIYDAIIKEYPKPKWREFEYFEKTQKP